MDRTGFKMTWEINKMKIMLGSPWFLSFPTVCRIFACVQGRENHKIHNTWRRLHRNGRPYLYRTWTPQNCNSELHVCISALPLLNAQVLVFKGITTNKHPSHPDIQIKFYQAHHTTAPSGKSGCSWSDWSRPVKIIIHISTGSWTRQS